MIASGHRGARLVYFPATKQVGRIIWGGLGVGGRDLQLSQDEGKTWSTPIDLTQGTSMAGYTGQVAVMDSAKDIHALVNPGDGKYVHFRTKNGSWLPHSPTGWQASDWIEMAVAEGNTLVAVYWIGGNTYTSHAFLDAPKLAPSSLSVVPGSSSHKQRTQYTQCDLPTQLQHPPHTGGPILIDRPRGQQQFQPVAGHAVWHSLAVVIVLGVVLFQLGRRARRTMNDLVSVIMPVYNAETFVAEAIDNVLAQTYPHWELIIVDDGLTDASSEILKRYADPRIVTSAAE